MKNYKSESVLADLAHWERIRSGDSTAFSYIFRKHYEQLYRFAGRFVKDTHTAENIVQNVFVNLWIERNKRHIQTSLKSYLYKMVKNHSLNYLKREKKMDYLEKRQNIQENFNISPDEKLLEKELHIAVHNAINKLPSQCRQIYLMKRYDDLKYTEIAEILNISINTVKTQMKRALKSLLKQLSPFMIFI